MSHLKVFVLFLCFSVLTEEIIAHGVLTPLLHTAPKLALGSLRLAGKSLLAAKKVAPILIAKKALILKPLILKGLLIHSAVKLVHKKPIPYSYGHGKTYGSYGTSAKTSTVQQSVVQRVIPSITFPEVNVPVRLSIGGGNNRNSPTPLSPSDDRGFSDSGPTPTKEWEIDCHNKWLFSLEWESVLPFFHSLPFSLTFSKTHFRESCLFKLFKMLHLSHLVIYVQ